jgi:hypothetical protein
LHRKRISIRLFIPLIDIFSCICFRVFGVFVFYLRVLSDWTLGGCLSTDLLLISLLIR